MRNINFNIEKSWGKLLKEEFQKPYFISLQQFLTEERRNHIIYPPEELVFSAFNRTPFEKIKVVVIGQDPYHGDGQANGLCFSVSDGIKIPPSLKNIFKEIDLDLGFEAPITGNLEPWTDQGVLMLNATLTVRHSEAGSHQKKGWELFTDNVIKKISEQKENVVFLLWGKFAQSKEILIDSSRHFILKAAHPSPFSAYRGFFGCKHFSKTNQLLEEKGMKSINWKID